MKSAGELQLFSVLATLIHVLMRLIESYPVADPVFHRHFSSSFERYYNNKSGNRDDDDNSSLSGRRESRVSLLSIESYPNVSRTSMKCWSPQRNLILFCRIQERYIQMTMI